MRARVSTARVYSDVTLALVWTPLGEMMVEVDGYHAERESYPVLIEAGLDKAWHEFCNAEWA